KSNVIPHFDYRLNFFFKLLLQRIGWENDRLKFQEAFKLVIADSGRLDLIGADQIVIVVELQEILHEVRRHELLAKTDLLTEARSNYRRVEEFQCVFGNENVSAKELVLAATRHL